MIYYIVFSYMFMLGFIASADEQRDINKKIAVIALLISPASMPFYAGVAFAKVAIQE